MGFATTVERDLSMIDDTYYLHFSVRSDAAVAHVPVRFRLGSEDADAIITLGSYSTAPIIGDFKRDGEWYSFDIPMQEFRNLCTDLFPAANGGATAYKDNLFVFKNGNRKGDELQIDNMFFWRNHQQPTMVDQLPLSDTAVKRAAAVYDLQGRRVADVDDVKSGRTSLRKGIYIINGKKVVL